MIKKLISNISSNLLFILLLSWIMIPYFAYNSISRILAAISILIIIIKYYRLINKSLLFATTFFIIYTFIINAIASDSIFLLRHLQLYIFLILILISSITVKFSNKKKQQLLIIMLSFNLIALIGTYFGLINDSHVARSLSKSGEGAVELTKLGVGGYGIVYMNSIIFPLFLLLIKTLKDRWIKLLILVNFVLSFVIVLKAGFLIAISLIVFQFFYLVFLPFNIIQKQFLILFFSIGSLFILNNIDEIERISYPLVEESSLKYKHADIFNIIKGEKAEYNTVSIRLERYERSLRQSFLNPVVGLLSFNNVGKHSNILDIFAQFGIFMGILFLYLLRKIPLSIIKKMPKKYKNYINCFFWSLLILGTFNNFSMQNGILFLLTTCIINIYDQRLIQHFE